MAKFKKGDVVRFDGHHVPYCLCNTECPFVIGRHYMVRENDKEDPYVAPIEQTFHMDARNIFMDENCASKIPLGIQKRPRGIPAPKVARFKLASIEGLSDVERVERPNTRPSRIKDVRTKLKRKKFRGGSEKVYEIPF